MNEQDNSTSAAFMEVTSRKVEGQDKKIAAIEEKMKDIPANTELLHKLWDSVEALRSDLREGSLLPEKIGHFSNRLELATNLLKQPAIKKVIHHHYIPKLIWISVGLFIAFCMVCSGWYITSTKLDGFVASDTKYRQLRLDTAHKNLQLYLDQLDSLYKVQTDLRGKVLETEEEYRLNFERLQKAKRLKIEARNLEKAAGRK
jgi:hypothetical protein